MTTANTELASSRRSADPLHAWTASASFGIGSTGGAADRRSLFAAAGTAWDQRRMPAPDEARSSDYPFSYDVSDGHLLAAIDEQGMARRIVLGTGRHSVAGVSIPGVYVEKEFAFAEGRFGVQVEGADAHESTFLDDVVPLFTAHVGELIVRQAVHVRRTGSSSALRATVFVQNPSAEKQNVTMGLVAEPCGSIAQVPITIAWLDSWRSRRRPVRVEAGETVVVAFEITTGSERKLTVSGEEELLNELGATVARLRGRYGALKIAGGQWYADFMVRCAELCRQSSLHDASGASIGSFWGSNANPIPDVWTRDLFYTALSSAQFDATDACTTIDFLAGCALPERPWGKENETDPREDGLSHSLGNAVCAISLAGFAAQTFGTDRVFAGARKLADHCRTVANALLGARPRPGELYPSHYISDGPSRGDFHTGSNVLAWHALCVLGSFATRLGIDNRTQREIADLAADLAHTIRERCVAETPSGTAYVEGVNRDGTVIAGHDGEESDLTLAPSYGFTRRFDPAIIRHARLAFTQANPYYDAGAGGVTFWDWDDYNGVTFPAYIHALASASRPAELNEPLEAIRRLTDLDGSLWWWPHPHRADDPYAVKRGLGKCGWCAGAFVQRFVHDILGIDREADRRRVLVSPATPWREYHWRSLPFLNGLIDIEYQERTTSVTLRVHNSTAEQLHVVLEAPVPEGALIEDIRANGENERYRAQILTEGTRAVVRSTRLVEPGCAHELSVQLSK